MFKDGFHFTHLEEDYDDAEIMGNEELQPQSTIPNANDFVPQIPSNGSTDPSKSGEKNTADKTLYINEQNTLDSILKTSQTTANNTSQSNFQVQYADGKINVMRDSVVMRPNGTPYIDTQGIAIRWTEHERPLRKRRLLLTKIFSVVAAIIFFPTGIPALYCAFRAESEFNTGIVRGDIDRALKFAKRSEKFIFISVVMSIVLIALIVTIIERPANFNNMPRGTLVG